jgi:hypothetical protein
MKHVLRTDPERLVLELSDEPGPDHLTTRGIQKGLAAYHAGECLVQEGLGFGAPIIGTKTETYFSKTAMIEEIGKCLIKTYQFDCATQIVLGNKKLENPALHYGFEALVGLYMRLEAIQPALLKLQRGLARSFNANCRFIDVEPIGSVCVIYRPIGKGIRITAEFRTSLKRPQFIMVNEQGADFFDRAELDGKELAKDRITGWMSGQSGRLASSSTGINFSITDFNNARLFAGRERTPYLSWAGLDLHSRNQKMEYKLVIEDRATRARQGPGSTGHGVISNV